MTECGLTYIVWANIFTPLLLLLRYCPNTFRLSPDPKRISNKATPAHSRLLASKAIGAKDEDIDSDSDWCVGTMIKHEFT